MAPDVLPLAIQRELNFITKISITTKMRTTITGLLFLTSCVDQQKKECHTFQGEIEVESGAYSDVYKYDSLVEYGFRTRVYNSGDSIDFKTSEVSAISYQSIQECEIVYK